MLRTEDLYELRGMGAVYNGGDDTGLLIPLMAKEQGWKIDGFKPTRCPLPMEGCTLDPEFNRYVCMVFGDMVYHHGGWTRIGIFGDSPVWELNYGWIKGQIMKEYGAEWILDEGYEFTLDREEEVAKEKMDRLFGLRSQLMKG